MLKIGKNCHFRSNNSKTSYQIFLKFLQHIDLVLLIIFVIHILNLALIVSKIIAQNDENRQKFAFQEQ